MELATEKQNMLDVMLRPAFWVADGIIRHINPSAAALMLPLGAPIAPFLATGQEDYASFREGCLHLQLCIAEQHVDARILQLENGQLFLPDLQGTREHLQLLNLAATQLREPLAGLVAISEQFPADTNSKYANHANHRLYQMLRIIGNMSDAQRFSDPARCHMEYTDICSFLEEVLEKADTFMAHIGIQIHRSIPSESIYTLLDREQVERSVYNLLSNAAKFGASNKEIAVQLTKRGQRLYVSVLSKGNSAGNTGNFYARFLREPSLEDPTQGIGLGMVMIRSTAINHGGTVLIDHPENDATRVTMTLAIRQGTDTTLRSPVFRIDYAGERDHALLELADILPAELYTRE